jgi:hypothetical protein
MNIPIHVMDPDSPAEKEAFVPLESVEPGSDRASKAITHEVEYLRYELSRVVALAHRLQVESVLGRLVHEILNDPETADAYWRDHPPRMAGSSPS